MTALLGCPWGPPQAAAAVGLGIGEGFSRGDSFAAAPGPRAGFASLRPRKRSTQINSCLRCGQIDQSHSMRRHIAATPPSFRVRVADPGIQFRRRAKLLHGRRLWIPGSPAAHRNDGDILARRASPWRRIFKAFDFRTPEDAAVQRISRCSFPGLYSASQMRSGTPRKAPAAPAASTSPVMRGRVERPRPRRVRAWRWPVSRPMRYEPAR